MFQKKQKKTIGLVEVVRVIGKKGTVSRKALVDTGATRTCIDMQLAAEAGMGPIVSTVRIKNKKKHAGCELRPVVRGVLEVRGVQIPLEMSVEDRSGRFHKILLGRDVLYDNFVVDIQVTHNSNKIKDVNA